MTNSRIATRYARPLLELAEEKKVLDAVYKDMKSFSDICKSNRDFLLMLKSPIIPHARKAAILKKIFEGKVNELTLTAFDVITRKNRESILPDIAAEFLVLYNLKMGYQEATVITPVPLDGALRKQFEEMVKKLSGRRPDLKEKVDESLIGGYVLKMGDRQIDESISGQLSELKLKFQKESI